MLPGHELDEILRRVAAEYQKMPSLSYYNRHHLLDVEGLAWGIADDCFLPREAIRLLRIAALTYNLGHSGHRYRQPTSPSEYPDFSNEEYAAVLADRLVADFLSLEDRLTLQGLILATTYGQNVLDRVPVRALLRPYAPTTPLECILAFADVGSTLVSEFSYLLRSFFELAQENSSRQFRDPSAAQPAMRGFIAQALSRLNAVTSLGTHARRAYEAPMHENLAHVERLSDDSAERRLFLEMAGAYLPVT
jgi:hypothetical protein